jgi:ATP-dependent helicase HrpB
MFLQLLRRDPALEEAGLVIFDEFHERSLQSDLGLALTLQTAALIRPELRILLMSATLDGESAARLVDGVFLSCPGRQHPVAVRYLGRDPRQEVVAALQAALKQILAEEAGDVLVFLPGTGMIRELAERLGKPAGTEVLVLHGRLPLEEQRRALSPAPDGGRRIILATSIAETSLTVPGVRVVLDSGLKRLPFYDPGHGMTRLCTVTISRATAEQRSGRAGRTAPGVAYRLWSPGEERQFAAFDRPAILEEDLDGLVLERPSSASLTPGRSLAGRSPERIGRLRGRFCFHWRP